MTGQFKDERTNVNWWDALLTVPRVGGSNWNALGWFSHWLIASRASVTIMTAIAALIGGLKAATDGQFDFLYWLVCFFGLMLAHATSNLVNDFVDTSRGLDSGDYHRAQYGTHVLNSGYLTRQGMMYYIAMTGLLALICGLLLISLRGGLTGWFTVIGAVLLLGYTWPLKGLGLGEPAVLLVWGPLMVGGSYYVTAGHWSWVAGLLGLIYALGPTAVLFAKHIDKLDRDKAAGVVTLPVRLGRESAGTVAAWLLPLAAALPVVLALLGVWPPAFLMLLAVLPGMVRLGKVFKAPPPESCPPGHPENLWPLWYTPQVFAANRRLGGTLVLALLVDLLYRWFPPA